MKFNYRGFQLHCGPMPMRDGRYGAQVIISNNEGDQHIDRKFSTLEYFSTEAEAISYAKDYGMRWIDEKL